MRVLFAGTGASGSWLIRGVQLSESLGLVPGFSASAEACFSESALDKADVVILVKRAPLDYFYRAHQKRKVVVWDPVDFWTQTTTSAVDPTAARRLLRSAIAHRRPHAVLFTNRTMQADAEFAGDSLVLPHHHYPLLRCRPVADVVRRVVYHGGPFLGEWEYAIRDECARRQWLFDTSGTVDSGDVAVAFRGGCYQGYMASHWKSNVKLANMHAAGVPCVIEPSSSYMEQGCGSELYASNPQELCDALDRLHPKQERQRIAVEFKQHAARYTVGRMTSTLANFLRTIA